MDNQASTSINGADNDDVDAWPSQLPKVVRSFPEEWIRSPNFRSRVAKAVSLAMKECGRSRDELAEAMSQFLGEDIGANMLNAYASESRREHVINVPRFLALFHATGDVRLLQLLADPFDFVVIPRKLLPVIEEVMWAEQEQLAARNRQAARERWKCSMFEDPTRRA